MLLEQVMRRILTLTALALCFTTGAALADRRGGGPTVRDHRDRDRVDTRSNNIRGWNTNTNRDWNRTTDRTWSRDRDRDRGRRFVRVERTRPTFRDNRFYFGGGTYRPYVRPVINVRYRDYYRRPSLVVENYDPVPGYIWIQGSWNWSGYEWTWMPGHYDVDTSYDDRGYYDNSSYDNSSYDNGSYDNGY